MYTPRQKGYLITMTDRFYNALGLARRAGKLSIGHDDVKMSVKSSKAKIIILTCDASERLHKEMINLSPSCEIIRVSASMDDMYQKIGKKSGIFSVHDEGLKTLVLSTIKEDSIYGKGQQIQGS